MRTEKNPEKIKNMFSQVAGRYDLANSVLSVGVHHLWRKKLVATSKAFSGSHVLDCATGTGDLAIAFKKVVGPKGEVIGTDFCADMLKTAPQKAQKEHLDIDFQVADAMNLPFEDQRFDIVSISFGIRNVADPVKALREMARVTKPNGQVMVLEFGQPNVPVFSSAYKFYSEKILPQIGGFITGQRQAYSYLQTSSAEFPCREEFLKMADATGCFSKSKFTPLTGGIAYIYKLTVR